MEKTAREKIASHAIALTKTAIENFHIAKQLEKEAELIIDKMPDAELKQYNGLIQFGRGMAHGYQMGKQASYDEVIDEAYNNFMTVVAKLHGEKFAAELNEQMLEAGGDEPQAEEEIVTTAAEAAAQELIQQAGGMEAIQANPELAQSIMTEAQNIGQQVAEDIKAELAQGAQGGQAGGMPPEMAGAQAPQGAPQAMPQQM